MKHMIFISSGEVQGVCFRARSKEKAGELGLFGFVRNEADGSVLIEVEGDEDDLQVFENWVNVGPEAARVDHVKVSEGEILGYSDFIIQR